MIAESIKARADIILAFESRMFWNLHLYGFRNVFEVLPNKFSQSFFESKTTNKIQMTILHRTEPTK